MLKINLVGYGSNRGAKADFPTFLIRVAGEIKQVTLFKPLASSRAQIELFSSLSKWLLPAILSPTCFLESASGMTTKEVDWGFLSSCPHRLLPTFTGLIIVWHNLPAVIAGIYRWTGSQSLGSRLKDKNNFHKLIKNCLPFYVVFFKTRVLWLDGMHEEIYPPKKGQLSPSWQTKQSLSHRCSVSHFDRLCSSFFLSLLPFFTQNWKMRRKENLEEKSETPEKTFLWVFVFLRRKNGKSF